MRVLLLPLLAASLPLLAACGGKSAPRADVSDSLSTAAGAVRGDTLVIDTTSSEIGWTGRKVTGKHDGTFGAYDGYLIVDTTGVKAVFVHFDTRTITSDTPRLTEHLRSDDFFAVERFPDAVFSSTRIVPLEDSLAATTGQQTQFAVTGNLTMRGVTRSVTFPASIRKSPSSVAARAEFAIDRKEWGIVYTGKPDDLIRDDVDIRLHVVARPKGVPSPGAAIRAAEAFRDSVQAPDTVAR